MVLFEIFKSKKSDPNIHQNAPNCTIYKKFSRGCMPPNPPSIAHGFATCKFPNLRKKFLPPPPQILGTPMQGRVEETSYKRNSTWYSTPINKKVFHIDNGA